MRSRQLVKTAAAAAAVLSLAVAGSIAGVALARPAAGVVRAVVVVNREGLAARDNRNFGIPPDPTGAIGRQHYLEAVNPRLALYDRNALRLVRARDAYAFWGRPTTVQIVDPQIAWDDGARRWYYLALMNDPTGGNELLLAWTKRGDPANLSNAWCRMSIRTGTFFDDFPKLGFSRNHILVSTNVFDLGTREFLFSRLWVIGTPVSGPDPCARPPVTSFGSQAEPLRRADGNIAFTLVPVDPVRPTNRAYVVAADCVFEPERGSEEDPCATRERTANQLTIWHVDGPRGAPKLTQAGGIDVPIYRLPRPARQRGTPRTLDTSDTRLYQAISAPDPTLAVPEAIWTQHTVAGPGERSEVRWYELDPERLVIARRGTIRKPRDWVFSAAISPTARGDRAVVHFVVSGRKRAPELHARSRGPRTPKSAMTGEIVLARSVSSDRCSVDPGEACVWGDYAAATPDPRRRRLVWGSNELVGSRKHPGPLGTYWRTRNFALRPR
jgi:hypothetical protein